MRKETQLLIKYNFKLYRKCNSCEKVFNHSEFAKDKTCRWDISRKCKNCNSKLRKASKDKYRASEKGKLTEEKQRKAYYSKNSDILKKKSRDYYNSDKGKEVISKYRKSEARKNTLKKYEDSGKGKITRANYYEKNKDHIKKENKKWVKNNPEKVKIIKKRYEDNNPHNRGKQRAKRRTLEKNSIPYWSESDKIKVVYKKAKDLENLTGLKYHVDHVIPLNHPDVCGLHVWSNLQILEAKENLKKSNKLIKGI